MFSDKHKGGNKPFVDSQTSSESKEANEVVDGDRVISTAKKPDCALRDFAPGRVSSSKKKFFQHNVNCTFSRIGDCELEDFRHRYRIPNEVKMFAPKLGETADNPPKDCFTVYKIMLENGLRLPANDFVNQIVAAVGRAPAQIIHNSWVVITAFQVACHAAGMKPSIALFKSMYKINYFNEDYMYFYQRENKNVTLLNFPRKTYTLRWEPYFFFVSANAFGAKIRSRFCLWKTVDFKCNRLDILLQYLEFSKKFPRRLLYDAYLDEKVLLRCNIYRDAINMPKESAYDLLLKANDALVQSAVAKNDKVILKLLKVDNLQRGKSAVVEASKVDSKVAPSSKLGGATSGIRRWDLKVTSDSVKENRPTATSVISTEIPPSNGSAALETKKCSGLDANGDQDIEIIDLEKFLLSKKSSSPNTHSKTFIVDRSSPNVTPTKPAVCSSLPASAFLRSSAGKRQADLIHKSIAPHLKKKRESFETLLRDPINDDVDNEEHMETNQMPINEPQRELVKESAPEVSDPKESFETLLRDQINDDVGDEEHMETDQMPINEPKRELVKDPEVSDPKDQDELDSISVQLDAILKKGSQSLQETSDHRIEMNTILASLEYSHLGASLEKATQQLSSLRDQIDRLHSRRAKLEMCLKNYNQQVSECKNNIAVLNSVRARLEAFGLKESPQEVSQLEDQVVKLNSIHSELETSMERCSQLEASLERSKQEVSIMDDQVKHLLVQNRQSTQEDSQLQLESLRPEFKSSLKEFDQLEGHLKMCAQNVRDHINQVGQLTNILAQLVGDVELANNDFKLSSASTKSLYEKARRDGFRHS